MLYTMEAKIWVQAPDGADPEDIASEMNRGLERAIEGFPAAQVEKADVKGIYVTPQTEIDEEGLGE